MSFEFYRLVHVLGALALLFGLGGLLAGSKDGGKAPAIYMALHGIGLLALLVAGIGVAHKAGYGFPAWMSAKVGCWVLLAATPILLKKGLLPRALAVVVVLGIAGVAAWLGLQKAI